MGLLALKVFRASKAFKETPDPPALPALAAPQVPPVLPDPLARHPLLPGLLAPQELLDPQDRLVLPEPPDLTALPARQARLEAPVLLAPLALKATPAPLVPRVCRVFKAPSEITARLDPLVLLALPAPQDRPALLAPQAPRARLVLVDPLALQALPAQAVLRVRRAYRVFKATLARLVRLARLVLLARPVPREPPPRLLDLLDLPERLAQQDRLARLGLLGPHRLSPAQPDLPGQLVLAGQPDRQVLRRPWFILALVLPTPPDRHGERHTPLAAPALWWPWQLAHL